MGSASFKYRGDYDPGDEPGTLWQPLAEFWANGPAHHLEGNRIVHLELSPGDMTHYEVTLSDVRGHYLGRALALAIFSPYNLCALLPLTDNAAEPFENSYLFEKLRGRNGINRHHRCARLLISRLAGLAADTLSTTPPRPHVGREEVPA